MSSTADARIGKTGDSGPGRTIALILVLLAYPLLFIPCALYAGNIQEFSAPLGPILRAYAAIALPVVLGLVVFAALVPHRLLPAADALLAVLALLVWLQSSFLMRDYGLLDGHGIDWDKYGAAGWTDSALWIAVIAATVSRVRAVGQIAVPLAFVVCAMQLAITASTVLDVVYESDALPENLHTETALEHSFRFSGDRNVVLIVMDGFQADIFDDIVNEPAAGPYFREKLSGFVFFRDHMGAFPTTYMSIPAMTSGRIYDNTVPKKRFMRESLAEHSILRRVHDAGYVVDIAGPPELLAYYRAAPHTNAYAIPDGFPVARENVLFTDAAMLLDLALFRATPHGVRRWLYNEQKWRVTPLVLGSEISAFSYFSHTAYAHAIAANLTADRTRPVFKLVHLMNTHWPMVVDDACALRAAPYLTTRATTTAQSRCSLAAVSGVLDAMRRAGIYDDALVVVMADHGAQLPPPRFVPARAPGNIIPDPWIAAQATPLLAVKLPGATGELSTSPAPSTIADVPATIAAVLGIADERDAPSVFDVTEQSRRERRFYAYEWTRDDWESAYAGDIQEFVVHGSVYTGDWRLGRVFAAPSE